MRTTTHLINGKSIDGNSGRTLEVWNPATGEQVGTTVFATVEEVDEAVAAARGATRAWAKMPQSERVQIMFAIRDTLIQHTDELARLITEENGKTLDDARGEIRRGLESVEFACGIPHLIKGEHSSTAASGIDVHSIRQPVGVVACITPFNFPVMVPLWMLANALACGNAVVLKPSEKAPTSTLRMAELLIEAGLPAGVLNLVNGDKVAVDRLLGHREVNAVSFIGSTPVARYVYETGTGYGKRVQALGGAKNHMIVMPDADMDFAAESAVAAGFGAAGERCMAVSVLVAVGSAGDEVVPRIASLIEKLKVGPGLDEGVEMGPLITREHRDKVASYIETCVAEGAELVADGRDAEISRGPGFFLKPTVIDRVTPKMSVYQNEIFGPVLSVVRVDTYEAALRLVNENAYGNGTSIFTRDGGIARDFQTDCEIGMVGVNVPIPTPVGWFSFGGWKSSLFGDVHMYGPDGTRFFTRQKVITTRW
ncbi:MAG: CoA-acylating methylmalonate-semialdehyde dehydrogenase [Nocardioidaceae bacterium]